MRLPAAQPRFLISVMDGGSFERRVLRLLDCRKQWSGRVRVCSGALCAAVMGLICAFSVTLGVRSVSARELPANQQILRTPTNIPTFDAVSIRKYGGPMPPPAETWDLRPDGYHGHAIPFLALIITAYPPSEGYTDRFTPDELTNVPEWMLRQFYDIDLKVAAADMPAWKQPAIQQAMLRAMLADRLKLVADYAHNPGQAFELQIAKGGVKFKPTTAPALAAVQQSDPHADAAPNGAISSRGKSGEILMYNAPISQLCRDLRHMAGRPILDKTGLTGRYDMTFKLDPPGGWPQPHDMTDTPFFATEQLGLKLVSVKTPVETLVIKHVEQPTAN